LCAKNVKLKKLQTCNKMVVTATRVFLDGTFMRIKILGIVPKLQGKMNFLLKIYEQKYGRGP